MSKNFLKITGIKCDTPGCDYREDDVPMEDYEEWLDRECPLCGANLLTQDDLNTVKLMSAMVAIANKIDTPTDEPIVEMKAEMNGTGQVNIVDMKIKEEK